MLTKAQMNWYWREWGLVRKAKPDADRHQLHEAALGMPKSSKDLDNADFDKILAQFRAISSPGSVNRQLRQLRQPVTRIHYSIRQILRCLALYHPNPSAYARTIARAIFKRDPEDLTEDQSHKLRMTLWGRINAAETGFRNQAGHSLHEMWALSGQIQVCECRQCIQDRAIQDEERAEAQADMVATHDANKPF